MYPPKHIPLEISQKKESGFSWFLGQNVGPGRNEEIHFSKQNSVQPVVCHIIHIYPIRKHYITILKNMYSMLVKKYSDLISNLNWDVVVTNLSLVSFALTDKLKK